MRSPSWESPESVSPRLRPGMIAPGPGRDRWRFAGPCTASNLRQKSRQRNGPPRETESSAATGRGMDRWEGRGLDRPTRDLVKEMTGVDGRTRGRAIPRDAISAPVVAIKGVAPAMDQRPEDKG